MVRPILALGLLVASIVGPRPVRAGQPAAIEYRDDRLTLHAHDTPVTAILDEVKRQSGAELRGQAAVASVTIDLDAVPLREALERLLGPRSFTLTYGENGRLKAIELRGGPQAAPVAGEERKGPPSAPGRKEMWDGVVRVFNNRGHVTMAPRLAEMTAPFMGVEKNGFVVLFRVAAGSQDQGMRRQAWRDGIRAVESDIDMRNALVAAVGMMDDAELTVFARALAAQTPDGAEDLAKLVLRNSSTPEIEARARGVLRQLRQDRAAQTARP